MKFSSRFWLIVFSLILLGGLALWLQQALFQAALPAPTPLATPSLTLPSPSISPSPTPSVSATPLEGTRPPTATPASPRATAATTSTGSVHLTVPFTAQAPDGDWVQPWADGCEEAALLMADAYYKGDTSAQLPPAATKQKIADMVNWQVNRFGRHKDITVDEMAIVAKEYLGYQSAKAYHNATLEEVKAALDAGDPVVIPAAGRLLKNPYFTQPGPLYHVFLVIGYDESGLIVNENGTRRGKDYRYTNATLATAWHDLVENTHDATAAPAFLVLQ